MSEYSDIEPIEFGLTVNGIVVDALVEPRRSLVDYLRRQLGLIGTRVGCEQGICGTCTVLCDGLPIRSCITLAAQVSGCEIETIENKEFGEGQHKLQQLFGQYSALQCGFCTPGFLLLIAGYCDSHEDVFDEEILDLVSSNLCRCTGYSPIIRAAIAYRDYIKGSEGNPTSAPD